MRNRAGGVGRPIRHLRPDHRVVFEAMLREVAGVKVMELCSECRVRPVTLGGVWCDECRAGMFYSEVRWQRMAEEWKTHSPKSKAIRRQRPVGAQKFTRWRKATKR